VSDDILSNLAVRVVGQPSALEAIVPSLQLHASGLAPVGRPLGIYILNGPTGTGKTRTVEAIADVLHGDPQHLVRINCAEFQSDHEISKLIGAPPGYVGHSDTKPRLTQGSLAEATSPTSDLAVVLFDEIEKAAPAFFQLLLGILDRATLRLGDGSDVDFTNTLLFMTSNLGAREMNSAIRPRLGFNAQGPTDRKELEDRLERIGMQAVKNFFDPEFVNRIDAVITYRPLGAASIMAICDQQIGDLQRHVNTRLAGRSFDIDVAPAARYFLIDKGTSVEYGARELKRVIHRHLTQPLAAMLATDQISPGARVHVEMDEQGESLTLHAVAAAAAGEDAAKTVLVVDDNVDLTFWMERVLVLEGFQVRTAMSVKEALAVAAEQPPDVAVLDYMLPDGDGVLLATDLLRRRVDTGIIIVSGMDLDAEARAITRRHHIRFVRKPFLAEELVAALRSAGARARTASSGGGPS
jgi:CheY-like chemotaxis protein